MVGTWLDLVAKYVANDRVPDAIGHGSVVLS